MSTVTANADDVFVVLWKEATPAACNDLIAQLRVARQRAGKPLVYLAVMPADLPRINDDGRQALLELVNVLADLTAIACVAMEARGFSGAAVRAMLSGIMLVTGKSGRVRFVDSLHAAWDACRAQHPADQDKMRDALARVGLTVPA